MKISVTQEDIDKGERNECRRCPVALALARAGFSGWEVDAGTIFLPHSTAEPIRTPVEVTRFVLDFDEGLPVFPFTFELPV